MTDLELQNLLNQLDALQPARVPARLAEVVRRRVRQRRRLRRTFTGSSFAFVIAGVLGLLVERSGHRQVDKAVGMSAETVSRLRAEIAELGLRANQHEALAREMLQVESAAKMQRQMGVDALTQLSVNRAAAAGILVARAGELERAKSVQEAIVQYERVVELFGDTLPGAAALQRLREIRTSSAIPGKAVYSGVISWHAELA